MRLRLAHLALATAAMAVLLAGQQFALLSAVMALTAYMSTLSLLFGKQ
jgi:hypothetical protein